MRRIYRSISHRSWAISIVVVLLVTAGGVNASADKNNTKKSLQRPQPKKQRVDVNSANAQALEELPGIDVELAEKIRKGRPYHSLADLGKIQGISNSELDLLKDRVTFGPVSTPSPPATGTPAANQQTTTSKPLTPTGRAARTLPSGIKININTATADQLDVLSGIGPTKARAIVDYRNEHGEFKSIDDIRKVKGIGGGEFSKIQDQIKVTE